MRATMSALDVMQMAQDTTRGGGAIARVFGISIMTVSRAPLEDWNKTINVLGANEAHIAAQRLEAILSREPNLTRTLLLDKRASLIELRRIFNVEGWRYPYTPNALGGDMDEGPIQDCQRRIISKRAIYDIHLTQWSVILAIEER